MADTEECLLCGDDKVPLVGPSSYDEGNECKCLLCETCWREIALKGDTDCPVCGEDVHFWLSITYDSDSEEETEEELSDTSDESDKDVDD